MNRISRETAFARIVRTLEERSTCTRRKVGALIVLEGRILSTGYAGSPAGLGHCLELGCLVGPDGGCQRTIHAEANAIAFAAHHGIALKGGELWCSLTPCLSCAKLIVNSGISRVHALEEYRDAAGVELLQSAKIPCEVFDAS